MDLEDIPEFTKEDYLKEKSELEKLFFDKHGIKPEDIEEAVRNHDYGLSCCNPLVERWIENEAFKPYLDF